MPKLAQSAPAEVKQPWLKGRMRNAFMDIPRGATVWIKKAKAHYTGIGNCWWVMSDAAMYLFSETFAGRGMEREIAEQKTPKGIRITSASDLAVHKRLDEAAKAKLRKGVSPKKT